MGIALGCMACDELVVAGVGDDGVFAYSAMGFRAAGKEWSVGSEWDDCCQVGEGVGGECLMVGGEQVGDDMAEFLLLLLF